MLDIIKASALRACKLLAVMTVLCGVLYPLLVTGVSQLVFPAQANGSLITVDGKTYGSALLAQAFTGDGYFWGRVMRADTQTFSGADGQALAYGEASNLTPAGAELERAVARRISELRAAHPGQGDAPVPVDLVTCSGSGLDPHISPAAAAYQVERVAKNRGLTPAQVEKIVVDCTEEKFLGLLGEKTVNVLRMNLTLDGILQ